MNAQEAIRAHLQWKDRLRVAMAKHEQLQIEKVASDCCCKFGQWLHSEGKAIYGHRPEFAEVVAVHAEFHVEASRVAEVINQGLFQPADRMMAAGSDFAKISEELGIKLRAMFNTAASGSN